MTSASFSSFLSWVDSGCHFPEAPHPHHAVPDVSPSPLYFRELLVADSLILVSMLPGLEEHGFVLLVQKLKFQESRSLCHV